MKFFTDIAKDISARRYINPLTSNCSFTDKELVVDPNFPKKGFGVFGSSISGDGTALLVENGKIQLDAGVQSAKLPLPDHLFISHHHHDHVRGLRTIACRSEKQRKKVNLYINNNMPRFVLNWIEDLGDESNGNLKLHYIKGGDSVQIDKKTKLEFFDTNHSQGSTGISILKKRKRNFQNYITYPGDLDLGFKDMRKDPHIENAENLIIEGSHFGNVVSEFLYGGFGHSSFQNVRTLLKERDKEANSVTLMHLPYSKTIPMPCSTIESELKDFRVKDKGYIPTCTQDDHDLFDPVHRKSLKS